MCATPAPARLNDGQRHLQRRKLLQKMAPDVTKFYGYDVRTALLMSFLLPLQWSLMLVVAPRLSLVPTLALAYFVGACLHHMCFLSMHEAVHDLVFPQVWQNRLFSYLCNSPLIFPMASTFRRYHLLHHAQQGSTVDVDEPTEWEKRTFLTTRLGRAFWLSTTFIWYLFRPVVIQPHPPGIHEAQNIALQACILAGALRVLAHVHGAGTWASLALPAFKVVAYSVLCSALAMGPTVWVAHFVAEHKASCMAASEHAGKEQRSAEEKAVLQELPPVNTYSYYGLLNWFSFFVGYHVEHHDFPRVPGWKLPDLHKRLKGVYTATPHTDSWARCIYDFVMLPYEI